MPDFKGFNGTIRIADAPDGRIAAFICDDMDLPDLIPQVYRGDTGLLLLPVATPSIEETWVRLIHDRMVVFRAIEHDVSVVGANKYELSSAVYPYDRTLTHVIDAAAGS